MNSERRPNWTIIVALLMGIPNWIVVGLMIWFRLHPEQSKEAEIVTVPSPLFTGWLPIIVVSAVTTFYMIGLLVVMFRRRKIKDLQKENSRITDDLAKVETELKNSSWLQSTAIREATAIQTAVKVLECSLAYKDMDSQAPYINFNFFVLNMSVYSVRVEKDIAGWVDFAGGRLPGNIRRTDQNDDIPHAHGKWIVITQWLSKEDVAKIRTSNSQCSFTFKNLEIWIEGSDKFEHDRKVARGKLEITHYLERAGQGVSEDELKWLADIAEDQRKTIYRFVHFTNLQYSKHELLRPDPYIEFSMQVDNRSLFDISFADITGAVSFGDRELSTTPTWQSQLPISQGNVGTVSFRQRLTEEDVIHVLNGADQDGFQFDKLKIGIEGNHDLKPAAVEIHRAPLRNTELLQKYPKLHFDTKEAAYDWIISLGTAAKFSLKNPCYVTLLLDITNRRPVTIEVDTFKLNIFVKGKEHVAFADSGQNVHPHRFMSDQGFEAVGHRSFPNLNHNPPLILRPDMPASGALQFLVSSLQIDEVLEDALSLENTPFSLVLFDKSGEVHAYNGTLTSRNHAAALFDTSG